jgi:hypothetical protein
VIFILLTVVRVSVTTVLKEHFLGWRSNYEDRLKSSWTGGSEPLLCLPRHNDTLPAVYELFKRTSYMPLDLSKERIGALSQTSDILSKNFLQVYI